LLKRTLESEGLVVLEAANGREGLERLAEREPGLVLLDLMMPEMDGFEFIETLHRGSNWQSIPVVVITAKELTVEDRKRLNGGVERVFQKGSYDREKLLMEVRDLVAAHVQSEMQG
jgi:CheY-like chemotaxis protein